LIYLQEFRPIEIELELELIQTQMAQKPMLVRLRSHCKGRSSLKIPGAVVQLVFYCTGNLAILERAAEKVEKGS
jgi:hypothetical protein